MTNVCAECGVAIPQGQWGRNQSEYVDIHIEWHKKQDAAYSLLHRSLFKEILESQSDTIDAVFEVINKADGVNTNDTLDQ